MNNLKLIVEYINQKNLDKALILCDGHNEESEQYIINNILECLNNADHGIIFNLQYNKKTMIRNNIFSSITFRFLNFKY
mgnify:CR=1 FL=1